MCDILRHKLYRLTLNSKSSRHWSILEKTIEVASGRCSLSCVEVLHIRLQWQMSRHRCEEEGNSTTWYPKKLYGYNVVDLLIKPVALICLIWNLVTSPPGRPSRQRDYHPSTSKRKHQSVIGRRINNCIACSKSVHCCRWKNFVLYLLRKKRVETISTRRNEKTSKIQKNIKFAFIYPW